VIVAKSSFRAPGPPRGVEEAAGSLSSSMGTIPGCRHYSVQRDLDDDRRYHVFELWDDDGAFGGERARRARTALARELEAGPPGSALHTELAYTIREKPFDRATLETEAPDDGGLVGLVTGFGFDPSERARALDATRSASMLSGAETGNLLYCYASDLADPGRLNVLELWRSRAAFKAHVEAPHQRAFVDVRRTSLPARPDRSSPAPIMFFGEYEPLAT
jgi:quinol monooxygenase YgiN